MKTKDIIEQIKAWCLEEFAVECSRDFLLVILLRGSKVCILREFKWRAFGTHKMLTLIKTELLVAPLDWFQVEDLKKIQLVEIRHEMNSESTQVCASDKRVDTRWIIWWHCATGKIDLDPIQSDHCMIRCDFVIHQCIIRQGSVLDFSQVANPLMCTI